MNVQHINPDGMLKSPAFSQGIIIPAGARTLLIGGQNGVDEKGQVVGRSLGEQTAKAVEAPGSILENLVRVGVEIEATAVLA